MYAASAAGLAAVAVIAQVAFAHTHVREAIPADEAKVETAPTDVSVSFGEEGLPAQPGQISDGHLEVYDACGNRVDKEDSAVDMSTSTVTATAGGTVSGRYEMQWTVTSSDGAVQSGIVDFNVKNGSRCALVSRTDPNDELDFGIDVAGVSSKRTSSGVNVTLRTAAAFGCADLGKTAKQELLLNMDTNGDEIADVTGSFLCKLGKPKLVITGDGEKIATLAATRPNPTSIAVAIPRGALTAHVDLNVTATKEGDECADDKVCVDFAPNLGWLRIF
jgi:methionine-rich copper-binding protein CopC